MTGTEAIKYIENYTWSRTRLGLERTRELLERLGNPQKSLKFIHVAGSNGKGSTCAMLDSILREAGYRTGLYTSPHIEEFEERMRVNGRNISGDALGRITDRVRTAAEAMEDHPSQFEIITAAAMLYFLEEKCDIVVLEVGMGGEMDSTNVIDAPVAAVIVNIGLEHTEYLGDTLEKIALTKSGIIKPGSSVVCYDGAEEVTRVVEKVCHDRGVELVKADFSQLKGFDSTLDGQWLEYRGKRYFTALLGEHQLCNTAVVTDVVGLLRRKGFNIDDDALARGLENVRWPARLEVLNRFPLFVLDGGHNPQCAAALVNSRDEFAAGRKIVYLVGILKDKDYNTMLDELLDGAQEFFCLTPHSPRALAAEELAAVIRAKGAPAQAFDNERDAVFAALKAAGNDGVVICFGSLYMAGEVRRVFHMQLRK